MDVAQNEWNGSVISRFAKATRFGDVRVAMNAKQYMSEIVEPTIDDFANNPTSLRHAFLACVVTFHTVDYLAAPKKSAQRRENFRSLSPDFAAIDRIAHAFKHVQTGDCRSQHIPPLAADQITERPPAIFGRAVWGVSRWGDSKGGVTIKHEYDFDLLDTLKKVAEFLRTQIAL